MPQIDIGGSSNIAVFDFKVTIDLYNRSCTFDTSNSTYQNAGIAAILGISFQLQDQDGVLLTDINFTDVTKYIVPSTTQVFTLDLSYVNFAFLFQAYKITGAIKDANGTVYQTVPVFKTVCMPVGFTDSGYVPGIFQVSPDCANNNLTVKELTVLTYNNSLPTSVSKTGTLYYPTGTISSVAFTGTPFSNNVVYTGEYRINCTTVGTYDLSDEVFVSISYITASVFDVVCSDKMSDLICCIKQVQDTAQRNCDNAIGQHAKQQIAEISPYLLTGMLKEINGQDSSSESEFIKKFLKCNCGVTSIGQNEVTPINPSVYDIVIQGAGDVTVGASTIGSTKTYTVTSKIYQVVKGNTGDLAFTITVDTSVSNNVKYKITFDYDIMAGYILTTISNDPTLISQLNSLIQASVVVITGLNGKCVIDLSQANYFFTQGGLTGSTGIVNIVINGITYTAPTLFANNPTGIQTWLNSLSLGTFSVTYNSGTLSVSSNNNTHTVSTFTVSNPALTIQFQSTNKTLIQVLQAIVDYLCNLTSLQVALGTNLALCYFDYNGNIQTWNYGGNQKQSELNTGITNAICSLTARINNLTGLTCAKLMAIFQDSPTSNFTGGARAYGNDGDNCVGFTPSQIASGIITTVNGSSSLKTAWCAISCPTTTLNLTGSGIASITGTYPNLNVGVPDTNKILKTGYIHIGDMNTTPADPNCALLASSTNGISAYVYTYPAALANTNYLPIAILGNNGFTTWAEFNANFDCTLEVGAFTTTQFFFAISTTNNTGVQDLSVKFICVSTV